MIRAIIIDDNADARATLADDIDNYCSEVDIIAQADSVKTGISVINRHKPDLVFLDVQMGDGNGFQVLEGVENYNFKVIFTTGSGDYTLRAIKFSALDYLLKPIDPDELVTAVKKVRPANETAATSKNKDSIDILIENLKTLNKPPKRVALSSADRIHIIEVKDIIRCESQSNYTLFYLQGNKQILVTRTLKEFEEMFEYENFIRIHHSHLINLIFLREYVKTEGGYALMVDNSKIPVAVRKKDELLKRLGVH